MAVRADMTDYNYFDVEDFSVDSFFRSLELQSRFASNELEFSFAADLDNVPMSTVGCLESSRATSSNADRHLSAGDDMQECGTSSVESSADTSMNDAENAAAVDVFFRSLQLQSCLLRTDGENDGSRRCRADKSRSAGGDLLVQSQNDAEKSTCSSSVDGTTADPKLTLSGNWRDDVTACSSEKSPTNFDGRDRLSHLPNRSDVAARGSRLSPRRRTELNGSSSSCVEGRQRDCQTGSQQSSSSSAHAAQPETTAVASTSSSTCVGHMSNLSATCGATGETPSLLDQADPACSRDQPQTNPRPAETLCGGDQQQWVPDVGENGQFVGLSATERRQSERGRGGGVKGGRMWCGECGVMLSDKYCYVRHLLTPLHRRRADGYCVLRDSSSSSATATASTGYREDIAWRRWLAVDQCIQATTSASLHPCISDSSASVSSFNHTPHIAAVHGQNASCVDAAHSSIHTDDVSRLLSRRAPVQCRMCGFHGDTRSQLLDHLASASHSAQLMKLRLRRLRCAPCRLVGSCDDILRHVQCDPHANNMAAKPLVITAARRRQCTSTVLN